MRRYGARRAREAIASLLSHGTGLITDDEYAAKKKALLDGF